MQQQVEEWGQEEHHHLISPSHFSVAECGHLLHQIQMSSHLQDSHSRDASLSQPTAHDIRTDISQPELATLVLIFNTTIILQHASIDR